MKIESGIPIPKRNRHLQGELIKTLKKMTHGQSFVTTLTSSYVCTAAKRKGFKVTVRKVDGGTRVWLVK